MIFTDIGAPTPASPREQGEAKEGRMDVLDTETDYLSWLTVTVVGVIFVCFNGTIFNFVVKLWIYKNNRKKKHQRSVLKELELLKSDRHLFSDTVRDRRFINNILYRNFVKKKTIAKDALTTAANNSNQEAVNKKEKGNIPPNSKSELSNVQISSSIPTKASQKIFNNSTSKSNNNNYNNNTSIKNKFLESVSPDHNSNESEGPYAFMNRIDIRPSPFTTTKTTLYPIIDGSSASADDKITDLLDCKKPINIVRNISEKSHLNRHRRSVSSPIPICKNDNHNNNNQEQSNSKNNKSSTILTFDSELNHLESTFMATDTNIIDAQMIDKTLLNKSQTIASGPARTDLESDKEKSTARTIFPLDNKKDCGGVAAPIVKISPDHINKLRNRAVSKPSL